jgi:hypothetical protein
MADPNEPADPSTGERLLNEPVEIEHPAGRMVGLQFTNATMVHVERLFGSVQDFEDQLNRVREAGLRAPLFTFITTSLDAILWDDPPAVRDNRADCLELDHFGDYLKAISRAYHQYWPAPEEPNGKEPAPNSAGARPRRAGARSRGTTGTTVRSSSSGSARSSSG